MKLGIIFKKEFQDVYGEKKEFFGDEITIKEEWNGYEEIINIRALDLPKIKQKTFPNKSIQLLYLGDWNK